MPTSTATLRASLEKHNDAFESLLKLIPAKYYIAQEPTAEQVQSIYFARLTDSYMLRSDVKVPET